MKYKIIDLIEEEIKQKGFYNISENELKKLKEEQNEI